MAAVIYLASALLVLLGLVLVGYGLLQRRAADYEECEVCGKRAKSNVTLTNDKARTLGGGLIGGSSISATFCTEHLPE